MYIQTSRVLYLFVAFSLYFIGPFSLHAQSTRVSGTVIERGSGEPLPGVHIRVDGQPVGALTDVRGRFVFEKLDPGSYTLVASSVGYAAGDREIHLAPGEELEVDFDLKPVHIRLPNVEVLGDAFAATRSSAGAVHIISHEDLRLSQPLGTEEMLRKMPGVHVSTDDGISNRINVGIRGLYPRRSAKILVLEDGVPIQPALFVSPDAYYNPPSERIDAIEVIKNASNIRYGTNTIGGVINYVTRRPPVEPGGTLRLTGGENGYRSALGTFGGMLPSQLLGGEMQVLYKRGDGFRENTDFDVLNLTGKLLFRPARTTSISFKGNLHREDAHATYSALTPYMFEQDPRQNPFRNDFLATDRRAGDLNVKQLIGSNAVLTGTFYANHFQRYWWRQSTSLVSARQLDPSAPEPALIRTGTQGNRARLRDFYVYGFTPRLILHRQYGILAHEIEIGGRLHRETFLDVEIDTNRPDARPVDFSTASVSDLSHPDGRKRKNNELGAMAAALYLQNRVTFGALSLTPGIRFEQYRQHRIEKFDLASRQEVHRESENTRREILPALGFTYGFGRITLYGGVHTAYVPLTSSTAFMDLIDDTGLRVAQDLESEKSTNLEFGFRTLYQAPVNIEMAVFRNTVRNLIAAGRDASFQPLLDNLGRVRYDGVEIATVIEAGRLLEWSSGLQVDGNVTLLRSEILQGLINESGSLAGADIRGNDAPYAPRLLATAGLTARLPLGIDGRVSYSHVGRQFADFNNTVEETAAGDNGLLPAYGFLDGSLRYALNGTGLSVVVSGKNLTNQVYRGSRMHRASSGIFPGGFRQVNAGLEWNF